METEKRQAAFKPPKGSGASPASVASPERASVEESVAKARSVMLAVGKTLLSSAVVMLALRLWGVDATYWQCLAAVVAVRVVK